MITMQLGQVVNSAPAIKNVLTCKLPVKTAYQLSRIGKALGKELETYEEQRSKLIAELGEKRDDGSMVVTKENMPQFMEQLNELLTTEIKIDLDPVKVEALGEKAEVAPNDLLACEHFIVE